MLVLCNNRSLQLDIVYARRLHAFFCTFDPVPLGPQLALFDTLLAARPSMCGLILIDVRTHQGALFNGKQLSRLHGAELN